MNNSSTHKKKRPTFKDQEKKILSDMSDFWEKHGSRLKSQYMNRLSSSPEGILLNEDYLADKLKRCKTLIITANQVEGNIVTSCLMGLNKNCPLERIVADRQLYQFSEINHFPVVHIWPQSTSSFTAHGSFQAISEAFKYFRPHQVISLGVAFGAKPDIQHLGDVIVANAVIPYDAFNKVVNGRITLNPHETYETDYNLLANWAHMLGIPTQLEKQCRQVGRESFQWHYGSILSGGSVISDIREKNRLFVAASQYKLVGGEMEGHGIYFACEQAGVPCIIIKGICDWGALKNNWEIDDTVCADTIKNCVQAYATDNAFFALCYLLKQLQKDRLVDDSPQSTTIHSTYRGFRPRY